MKEKPENLKDRGSKIEEALRTFPDFFRRFNDRMRLSSSSPTHRTDWSPELQYSTAVCNSSGTTL